MRPALALLLFAAALPGPSRADEPWPYEAQCRKWADVAVPKQDVGSAPAGCDTQALYYGEDGKGLKADPVAARQCAYRERGTGKAIQEQANNFGGSGVLMMLYANGRGVKRNIPLAKRFACEYGGAPFEVEARLAHLDAIAGGKDRDPIDLCDDITSGLMMGVCAGREADFAQSGRDRRWTALQAAWSPPQRAALAALRNAAKAYFDSVASEETDMSGTARGALATQAYETLDTALLADVERFERRERPAKVPGDFARDDKALNAVYRKVLATLDVSKKKDDFAYGTVTSDGVRATQRLWLRYRDAWAAFAAVRYPGTPKEVWLAWLSEARSKALVAIVDDTSVEGTSDRK
ncbi:MAG: lysozyme inhibitor LprI family protein [Lysobacteraceae bacterium]